VAEGERFRGAAMVHWFAPRQVWSTLVQVVGARVRSDYRVIESLEHEQSAFEYPGDQLWLDFVAHIGDGFDAAYGIARLIARERLRVTGLDQELPGGDILVMGGDEVYPVASRAGYRQRLDVPYQAAFTGPERDLYALPGNHDWYDGLAAFMRRFCQGRRMGTLRTRQTRSYFALRLPADWWLLAIDLQLTDDIDRPQMIYFRDHALAHMRAGHRVIVCTAQPGWIYGESELHNFRFIEDQIHATGARVELWLTGDLHHYMRHAAGTAGLAGEAVIAGGGGAFLHPTHALPEAAEHPARRYPEPATSRRLALGNLGFFYKNWELGPFLGALYAVLGAAATTPIEAAQAATGSFQEQFHAMLAALFGHPFALLSAVLILAGCYQLAERGRWYRRISSVIHGLAHVGAALATAHVAVRVAAAVVPDQALLSYLLAGTFTIVGGGLVGLLLVGIYLTLSGWLGEVRNSAYAALRIPRYKNFVRLHLRGDGGLDLYAIGLDDVPRRWRRAPEPGPGEPRVVPDQPAVEPHLIEKVTVVGPRAAAGEPPAPGESSR